MESSQAKQVAFMKRQIEQPSWSAGERLGMRSAFFDAAHLCDAIARDIESGRPSKAKREKAAALKLCGDLLFGFYHAVPRPSTEGSDA